MNVFTALKGTHFYILFVVTAAGVVPCGSPKKRPRTSAIVQFIFYFWSFEIRRNIVKSENSVNIIGLDSYILNSLSHLEPIWIHMSLYDFIAEARNYSIVSGFYYQFIQGH